MEISTLIGLVGGVAFMLGAFVIEGGSPMALLILTAAMIVFGGTFGALCVAFPMETVLGMGRVMAGTFKKVERKSPQLIEALVQLAETARREGLLALESMIEGEEKGYDPMLKRGIQLVVDGTDPEFVKNLLELEVKMHDKRANEDIELMNAAGGFLPTMGVIGTVMGLVSVLANLANPDELGGSVAVAFVATLYGVATANLVALPMGVKLKGKAAVQKMERLLIIEGVLSIQAGENPRLIEQKLNAFLILHGHEKAGKKVEEKKEEDEG